MKVGENLTLCDGKGFDYHCTILSIDNTCVEVDVVDKTPSISEPTVKVSLYQGLPKSDKMDLIIQKVTELGAVEIIPTVTEFCVVDLKGKESKKIDRWQKIALEAAKQSGRGIIPKVQMPEKFATAVQTAKGKKILLYEGGGVPLGDLIQNQEEISVFVGPEGGLSKKEVELAKENGVEIVTLGKRILRTETAPISAISIIMYETKNME